MTTENEGAMDEKRYLVLSPELRRMLANNNISLGDILAQAALPLEEAEETPDPSSGETGQRDPATIILASSVAIATLTPLLTSIVRAYAGRSIVVEEVEQTIVTDPNGHPIRSSDGEPLTRWTKSQRVVPSRNNTTSTSVKLRWGTLLDLEIGDRSGEKPSNPPPG